MDELNLETLTNAFALYGLMWIIIFFLLLISHLANEPEAPPKNPKETGPDDPDDCS
jgi:hypothetical protein